MSFKTTILRVILVLVPAGMPAFGQGISLSLLSASATLNSTVTLPLNVASTSGSEPAGLQWTILYSTTDFSSITAAAGAAASAAGKGIDCASIGPGQYTCVLAGINQNTISNGTAATVTLRVSGTTTHTSSTVQVSSPVAASRAGDSLPATATGAAVAIVQSLPSPSLNGFTCNPSTLSLLGSSTCTVTLSGAAPTGGTTVALGTGTIIGVTLTIPSSVTVLAGATSANFTVSVGLVGTLTSVVLVASLNGTSKSFTLQLLPGTTGPTISSVSVAPADTSATITWITDKSATSRVDYGTSSASLGSTLQNSLLVTTHQITLTGLTPAVRYYYRVRSTDSSQNTTTEPPLTSAPASFTTAASVPSGSATGLSIWSDSAVPGTINYPDSSAVEIGVKFRSEVAGSVTGVRFYKGSSNTGTHLGHLWTSTGTLLASVTFTNETASGWQRAAFSSPVAIDPNRTYIISYYAPRGYYSADRGFFSNSGVDNPPLNALASGVDGSNGVYRYGSSAFPSQTYLSTNYWVDVIFQPVGDPISLFERSARPDQVRSNDSNAIEVGLKFRSDVPGSVTGIRFYKASNNDGTHAGHLWTRTGQLLATITFENETNSGWQEAEFPSPVAIQANTTYIISYYAPEGQYSADAGFFSGSGVDNGPLHALANGVDGPNGVYVYGASSFPQQAADTTNYWVDVVFVPWL